MSDFIGLFPTLWILVEGKNLLQFEATNQMLMTQALSVARIHTRDETSSIIYTKSTFWIKTSNAFKSKIVGSLFV